MSVSEYELVGGKGANMFYYLIPFNPPNVFNVLFFGLKQGFRYSSSGQCKESKLQSKFIFFPLLKPKQVLVYQLKSFVKLE